MQCTPEWVCPSQPRTAWCEGHWTWFAEGEPAEIIRREEEEEEEEEEGKEEEEEEEKKKKGKEEEEDMHTCMYMYLQMF